MLKKLLVAAMAAAIPMMASALTVELPNGDTVQASSITFTSDGVVKIIGSSTGGGTDGGSTGGGTDGGSTGGGTDGGSTGGGTDGGGSTGGGSTGGGSTGGGSTGGGTDGGSTGDASCPAQPSGLTIVNQKNGVGVYKFRNGESLAFRLTPDMLRTNGTISWTTTTGMVESMKLVTISQCAGDFRINEISKFCVEDGALDEIRYSTKGGFRRCELNPKETYFVNVKNGIERRPDLDTCPTGRTCGVVMGLD